MNVLHVDDLCTVNVASVLNSVYTYSSLNCPMYPSLTTTDKLFHMIAPDASFTAIQKMDTTTITFASTPPASINTSTNTAISLVGSPNMNVISFGGTCTLNATILTITLAAQDFLKMSELLGVVVAIATPAAGTTPATMTTYSINIATDVDQIDFNDLISSSVTPTETFSLNLNNSWINANTGFTPTAITCCIYTLPGYSNGKIVFSKSANVINTINNIITNNLTNAALSSNAVFNSTVSAISTNVANLLMLDTQTTSDAMTFIELYVGQIIYNTYGTSVASVDPYITSIYSTVNNTTLAATSIASNSANYQANVQYLTSVINGAISQNPGTTDKDTVNLLQNVQKYKAQNNDLINVMTNLTASGNSSYLRILIYIAGTFAIAVLNAIICFALEDSSTKNYMSMLFMTFYVVAFVVLVVYGLNT